MVSGDNYERFDDMNIKIFYCILFYKCFIEQILLFFQAGSIARGFPPRLWD